MACSGVPGGDAAPARFSPEERRSFCLGPLASVVPARAGSPRLFPRSADLGIVAKIRKEASGIMISIMNE